MPGKSRRGRGRHLPRSKRKGRKGFVAPAKAPAVAQAHEPAPEADRPVPSAKVPTPRATVTAAQAPNIAAELRRIGILAGIILVILVVLALIFS